MHVLLFDIDGTLLNTAGSGITALKTAFAEVFDRPAPPQVDTVGRTDRGIASELFRRHGITDTLAHWDRFHAAYLRRLAENLPRRNGFVLPGVMTLLQRLAPRGDLALGLLTGNTADGARIKLTYFGIDRYFHFGGYGDRHPERNAVATDALDAAQRHVQRHLPPERIWVIGDTPLDVRCARHIGARAVAVASGFSPREELVQERPDLLLPGLDQPDPLLERLWP